MPRSGDADDPTEQPGVEQPVLTVLDFRSAVIHVGADGIVRVKCRPGVDITEHDVRDHLRAARRGDVPGRGLILVDTTQIRSVSRAARELLRGAEAKEVIAAQAIVVGSPVSKLIGNFYLSLSRPPFPTALFSSETEAAAWLKGFAR